LISSSLSDSVNLHHCRDNCEAHAADRLREYVLFLSEEMTGRTLSDVFQWNRESCMQHMTQLGSGQGYVARRKKGRSGSCVVRWAQAMGVSEGIAPRGTM
jgi:hypothetical protein